MIITSCKQIIKQVYTDHESERKRNMPSRKRGQIAEYPAHLIFKIKSCSRSPAVVFKCRYKKLLPQSCSHVEYPMPKSCSRISALISPRFWPPRFLSRQDLGIHLAAFLAAEIFISAEISSLISPRFWPPRFSSRPRSRH